MAKILLVEDDQALCVVIKNWLQLEKHLVEVSPDGEDGVEKLKFYKYDLLILDWLLPKQSGFDVCVHYRSSGGSCPVLMLTAKNAIKEKEAALDAGADDYLTKPFAMEELSARVRALLRRSPTLKANVLQAGDLSLDTASGKVTKGGSPLHLTPKEFALLEFFMRHPDQVFSAERLMDHVWESESNTVRDGIRPHITHLRAKIDTKGEPSYISTVQRIGYRFDNRSN